MRKCKCLENCDFVELERLIMELVDNSYHGAVDTFEIANQIRAIIGARTTPDGKAQDLLDAVDDVKKKPSNSEDN